MILRVSTINQAYTREAFGMRRTQHKQQIGFTLVELITTLAVIAILLAFLIPALTAVQKTAMNVKQKAQFHTISLGLESFHQDNGYYPPSQYTGHGYYSAAERLAEAIIGQDGLGFHPSSRFTTNALADLDGDGDGEPLYQSHPNFATDSYYTGANAGNVALNLQLRTGPYLELEGANAVQIQHIYGDNTVMRMDSFVLVDMFKIKPLGTGRQTGMPILYYRADPTKVGHSAADEFAIENSTYNVRDALHVFNATTKGIAGLYVPFISTTVFHPMAANPQAFYNATVNPSFTAPLRPYRAESFILHSAGPDGLYGTIDDIFNFDSGK
jgi:prepilin-type N-terminal cleavage/methylation domain-containing protein